MACKEAPWSRQAWPRVFPVLDLGREPDAALSLYPWPLNGSGDSLSLLLLTDEGPVFLHSADHAQIVPGGRLPTGAKGGLRLLASG